MHGIVLSTELHLHLAAPLPPFTTPSWIYAVHNVYGMHNECTMCFVCTMSGIFRYQCTCKLCQRPILSSAVCMRQQPMVVASVSSLGFS